MKKVIYLSAIFILSVSFANATNSVEKENKVKEVKIVKIENSAKKEKNNNALFTRYKGICRDGTTFSFSADSREEAQGYVNGYCAALREVQE